MKPNSINKRIWRYFTLAIEWDVIIVEMTLSTFSDANAVLIKRFNCFFSILFFQFSALFMWEIMK